jgi:predicted nucleic acid-binding protein
VSAQVGNVYFDTCTLSNFASVGRLEILEIRYGHRARWTETIAYEVQRGRSVDPSLRQVLEAHWLGEPLEIDGDRDALREIENIRRGLGGLQIDPMQHRGEAEIMYHLGRREPSGIFVTDDRPALDFARNRGLFALDTSQVLAECFQQGEIGCPDAFDLLKEMYLKNRGVRVPANHTIVCP